MTPLFTGLAFIILGIFAFVVGDLANQVIKLAKLVYKIDQKIEQPRLKIYRISQKGGYYDDDKYQEAIVVAKDEEQAKEIHPSGNAYWHRYEWRTMAGGSYNEKDWAISPRFVDCEYIGRWHKDEVKSYERIILTVPDELITSDACLKN